MTSHRPSVLAAVTGLLGSIVAFLTSGRAPAGRWALGALLALLGVLVTILVHYYVKGG